MCSSISTLSRTTMATGPLIIVWPNNAIQIVIQPCPTATLDTAHTIQNDAVTMVHDQMLDSIKKEEDVSDNTTLHDMVDDPKESDNSLTEHVPDDTTMYAETEEDTCDIAEHNERYRIFCNKLYSHVNNEHKADITKADMFEEKVTKWLAEQKYNVPDTATEEMQRDGQLKTKYIRKKRACPISGCKRNNKPLLLSDHLIRHHKLSRAERMYWLKNL